MDWPDLSRWLQAHPGRRLHIVSPHLDDAVLSCHALLASAAGRSRCRVTTLFTEAAPGADDRWALETGFRDAAHEQAVRREEDRSALSALDVAFHHAGLSPEQWSAERAEEWAGRLLHPQGGDGPAEWVLLPAGAGRPVGALWRQACRVLRRPTGSDSHSEHRAVRDRLAEALGRIDGARFGFYGDVPYLWSDRLARIDAMLRPLAPLPLGRHALQPDPAAKLAAFSAYRSQLHPICGVRPSYQRRVLGIRERYWLPEA